MININAPPIKPMCGIDSLHLLVECSILELTVLTNKCGLGVFIENRKKWTTEFKLILAGEKIRIITSKQRKCRIEFGGLYYSRNSTKKLWFIREVTKTFRDWKISRLDFACDLKVAYQLINVEMPSEFNVWKEYRDSVYFNRQTKSRTYTVCAYDRSRRIDFFSFPLTRLEVRLYKNIFSNRKLGACLLEGDSLEKCAKLIDGILIETLALSVDNIPVHVAINAKVVLHNFVEFLQCDNGNVLDKDLFHMKEAFVVRDKVTAYLKKNKLSWTSFPKHCKMKQAEVCIDIGISQPILRKALSFAKGA